jgi:hypothetical protein
LKNIVWGGAILLAIVLSVLPASAQVQTYTLGQPLTATWNPVDNEADSATTVYQLQVGLTGTWTSTPQPVPQPSYRYNIPQALLILGNHNIGVRACRPNPDIPTVLQCGAESERLEFRIQRPMPGRVPRPGIGPTPPAAQLTIPQALDLVVNPYAILMLGRVPTPTEYGWLAQRHGNKPLHKYDILNTMDEGYALFVR